MGDTRTVAVVGGGPAGLIAAETLATAGVDVTVYDHMRSVGRKFLLAGRGGLNLTHSEPSDDFIARYDAADWIRPILEAFDVAELRNWAASLGEPTFVGSSGRVFPASFRATPLLRAWLRRLDELGVEFRTGHRWVGWGDDGAHRFEASPGGERRVVSDATILALGGASWPRVGSTGGWVPIVEHAGIDVVTLEPANAGVRVVWADRFVERFAGVPVKNVAVSVGGGGDAVRSEVVRGDVVVTDSGLEGGPIYGISRPLRDAFGRGPADIVFDLHPDLSAAQLALRLGHRRPKDSTSTWLRRAIGLHAIEVALLREATGNALPLDPVDMARLVKSAAVTATSFTSIGRAISTAGGVARHEVDEHLMLRRRPGTFVAGEMIDWSAPTGGYLLQASFATGVVAARGALAYRAPGARGRIA